MGPDVAQSRDRAYLELLHHGLVLLRNLAHAGQLELCRIEADHLHNLPTLVGESNEYRHEYYLRDERGLYLQRLRESGAVEHLHRAAVWYSDAWRVLASVAGVQLSE
jgi:hypothetical protein